MVNISAKKNGNWNDKYTWNPEKIPTKEDDVLINNYKVALQSKSVAKSVTLSGSGGLTSDSIQKYLETTILTNNVPNYNFTFQIRIISENESNGPLKIICNATTIISGIIGNNSSGTVTKLTKEGSCDLTLSSSINTYTGDTNINAGTLIINNPLVAPSNIIVNNGGTLKGNFTMRNGKTITVNTGGTILIGSSIGTINVTDLIIHDGSYMDFEVDGNNPYTSYDRINVSNLLTINSGAKLNISILNGGSLPSTDVIWSFITYGSRANSNIFTIQSITPPNTYNDLLFSNYYANPDENVLYVKYHGSSACLHGDTQIMMADGTEKKIRDIQRGDQVIGDIATMQIFKVARLLEGYSNDGRTALYRIPAGLIGNKREIVCSKNHVFWHRDGLTRSRAKNIIGAIKIPERDFIYCLQFETEGTYYAEGVKCDSMTPDSVCYKLPIEYYYDSSLYDANRIVRKENDIIRGKPLLKYENVSPDKFI